MNATPSTRISDVKARIEAQIAEHCDKLSSMPDPIRWLMSEEMKVARGGLAPIFLRPLVTVAYYGNDTLPRVLEFLQRECASLRAFMPSDKMIDLDNVEKATQSMIDGIRAKYAPRDTATLESNQE